LKSCKIPLPPPAAVKKSKHGEIGGASHVRERLFPPPVEIFSQLAFSKEGKRESSIESSKSSPPFEKGRTGGISGKAFSKR
jgi:hypothetical protein